MIKKFKDYIYDDSSLACPYQYILSKNKLPSFEDKGMRNTFEINFESLAG